MLINIKSRFITFYGRPFTQQTLGISHDTRMKELIVHSYDTKLKEKRNIHSMKDDVVLMDLQENNNIHFLEVFVKIPSIWQYIERKHIIPIVCC